MDGVCGGEERPNWHDMVLCHVDLSSIFMAYVKHHLESVLAMRRVCKMALVMLDFKPNEFCEKLCEHGTGSFSGLATYAAEKGDLLLLQFAVRRGCETTCVCRAAIKFGKIEVLKWVQGTDLCAWSESVCSLAAAHGQLQILKWARAQGCPWDEMTCASAVQGGHLATLQWLRKQEPPCPWDISTFFLAWAVDNMECVDWVVANGGAPHWVD
tara:strand:- start:62 stop:697 length:636 start_codon:yes stop_codon:yes gene_type:complete